MTEITVCQNAGCAGQLRNQNSHAGVAVHDLSRFFLIRREYA
jgi:hypothetical protein